MNFLDRLVFLKELVEALVEVFSCFDDAGISLQFESSDRVKAGL